MHAHHAAATRLLAIHEHGIALSLGNVPYFDARFELKTLLERLATPAFATALHAGTLETAFGLARGQPHELMTDLVRQTIIGLESYVVGAVRISALNAD
jgi:hypothetical protein